jgi:hypothetical protein
LQLTVSTSWNMRRWPSRFVKDWENVWCSFWSLLVWKLCHHLHCIHLMKQVFIYRSPNTQKYVKRRMTTLLSLTTSVNLGISNESTIRSSPLAQAYSSTNQQWPQLLRRSYWNPPKWTVGPGLHSLLLEPQMSGGTRLLCQGDPRSGGPLPKRSWG